MSFLGEQQKIMENQFVATLIWVNWVTYFREYKQHRMDKQQIQGVSFLTFQRVHISASLTGLKMGQQIIVEIDQIVSKKIFLWVKQSGDKNGSDNIDILCLLFSLWYRTHYIGCIFCPNLSTSVCFYFQRVI